MHSPEVRPLPKLTVDPQPRRDLEVPPMVRVQHSQGVSTVTVDQSKRQETENLFAGLDFGERR